LSASLRYKIASLAKRFNEFNLLGDVGCIENKSSELKAVRRQQSLEFAMPRAAYSKEAANLRWTRMKNMNARYHS